MAAKTIYTYECWSSDQPSLMGCLFADVLRGKESNTRQWTRHYSEFLRITPARKKYLDISG